MNRHITWRIRHKIILPFLALTLFVALAGSGIALWVYAVSEQDRLDNLVAEVVRNTNDAIVTQERFNLEYLRQIAFAPANPATGAPSISDALVSQDTTRLQQTLDPFVTLGLRNEAVNLDRLIAFSPTGETLIDFERAPLGSVTPYYLNTQQLATNPASAVSRTITAQPDSFGDKFADIIALPTNSGSSQLFLATTTPVYQDDQVVGNLLIAIRVDRLLQKLLRQAQAGVIVVYNTTGQAVVSTRSSNALSPAGTMADTAGTTDGSRSAGPTLAQNTSDLSESVLRDLQAATTPIEQSLLAQTTVDGRDYQLGLTPLIIRQQRLSYAIGAGLSREYVTSPLASLQIPVITTTIFAIVGIVTVGSYIARQITLPLEDLVTTSQGVMAGNLSQRSRVQTRDEVGLLAGSFNTMTEYLVRLYRQVFAEAGRRAAIVSSITDGILMCEPDGTISLLNPAARTLLGLDQQATLPTHIRELALRPLPQSQGALGIEQLTPLYQIGERILRISQAEVRSTDGAYLGQVYVFQDLTAELQIDRAKTEFISTISHELRTPITTLRGTSELLLRGQFGELSFDQSQELDVMHEKLIGLSKLITNVVHIATIDSGTISVEIEPVDLAEVVDEVLWRVRRPIKAKGLELQIDLPSDLPLIAADYIHLQTILGQLIDNAINYTQEGSITLSATPVADGVRVDVCDTGSGITPELQEHIFERFARSTAEGEGITSPIRGIGLGLSIAQQMLQLQGGRIWVESQAGQGSTFSFVLPYAPASTTGADSNEEVKLVEQV